ncbi:MAG: DNA primase [Woeseiaceae bacterium]|nr:DNA primase [Woeseiaceae bacterium]
MAGRIPQDFIDDLIARADIVEVVGRRVELKKAGREFKACCPFHDEKTPSFTVSPHKGFYHCFGCNAHGTAVGFLMEHDHMSFVEAIESLAGQMGVEVPRDESDQPARRYDELFTLMSNTQQHWQNRLREHAPAVAYLKERGVDGATAKRFGIGYSPDGWSELIDKFGGSQEALERLLATGLVIRKDNGRHYDRFRDRIMFPIRDARGRCIAFGGRAMGDGEPKYLNSPETVLFHKGRELYGLYEARQALRHIERLVVVEGYMDVVALARNGINFAVATLGTATTPDHLNQLFRLTDRVEFCFDGDRAGKKAAWRALETTLPHIREGRQVHFVFLPDGHDPDTYVNEHGSQAFIDLLDAGMALSEYLIEELASQVELDNADGRARLVELARPLVAKTPDGVYRELLIASLAERVGLSAPKLDSMIRPKASRPHDSPTPATHHKRRSSGGPSVVRRAITLLLHQPDGAVDLDATSLASVDRPGVDLLISLIETVQSEPTINTAGLLERWRHDEQGRHLGKLAAVEIPDDEDFDPRAELAACIEQLGTMGRRDRIDLLIKKQRVGPLTKEEKAELRALS